MAQCSKSGASCVNAIVRKLGTVRRRVHGVSTLTFRKQPIAAAVLATLTATPGATPTEARHSERWYLAHGYHSGPLKGHPRGLERVRIGEDRIVPLSPDRKTAYMRRRRAAAKAGKPVSALTEARQEIEADLRKRIKTLEQAGQGLARD